MLCKHLGFENAPFAGGFLEIILHFFKFQRAPFLSLNFITYIQEEPKLSVCLPPLNLTS